MVGTFKMDKWVTSRKIQYWGYINIKLLSLEQAVYCNARP